MKSSQQSQNLKNEGNQLNQQYQTQEDSSKIQLLKYEKLLLESTNYNKSLKQMINIVKDQLETEKKNSQSLKEINQQLLKQLQEVHNNDNYLQEKNTMEEEIRKLKKKNEMMEEEIIMLKKTQDNLLKQCQDRNQLIFQNSSNEDPDSLKQQQQQQQQLQFQQQQQQQIQNIKNSRIQFLDSDNFFNKNKFNNNPYKPIFSSVNTNQEKFMESMQQNDINQNILGSNQQLSKIRKIKEHPLLHSQSLNNQQSQNTEEIDQQKLQQIQPLNQQQQFQTVQYQQQQQQFQQQQQQQQIPQSLHQSRSKKIFEKDIVSMPQINMLDNNQNVYMGSNNNLYNNNNINNIQQQQLQFQKSSNSLDKFSQQQQQQFPEQLLQIKQQSSNSDSSKYHSFEQQKSSSDDNQITNEDLNMAAVNDNQSDIQIDFSDNKNKQQFNLEDFENTQFQEQFQESTDKMSNSGSSSQNELNNEERFNQIILQQSNEKQTQLQNFEFIDQNEEMKQNQLFKHQKPDFHMTQAKDCQEEEPVIDFENIQSWIRNSDIKFKLNEDNQKKNKQLQKIFEQFYIITADKKQCQEIKNIDEKVLLQPQVIYNYPNLQNQEYKDSQKIISSFAFPELVDVKRCVKTDSMSQLNEIIFCGSKIDRCKNCFIFAIKSDESYLKVSRKDVEDNLLNLCNPSHLIYCICAQITDFYDGDENNQNQKKKKTFLTVQSVLCILTYYPFINFFIDVIQEITQKIKIHKLSGFQQCSNDGNISKVDAYSYMQVQNEIQQVLNKVLEVPPIDFNYTHKICDNLTLEIPQSKELCLDMEGEWGMHNVLNNLNCEEFVYLYMSILLEESIVFIAKDRNLLTQTISLFHSILKPFKWPHPIIFTVTEELIHILDSPVPVIVGLNKDDQFIKQENYEKQYEHCTFMYLQKSKGITRQNSLIFQSNFYQKLVKDLKQLFKVLKDKYSKCNQRELNLQNKNQGEYNDILNISRLILQKTREYMCKTVIFKLPQDAMLRKSLAQVLDFQAIQNQLEEKEPFLQKFYETQIFIFFLEEYYGY